jgi:hypothetical protein
MIRKAVTYLLLACYAVIAGLVLLVVFPLASLFAGDPADANHHHEPDEWGSLTA